MTDEEARAFLEELFAAVLSPGADARVVDRYFTADYQQQTNEARLDRARFEEHLVEIKTKWQSFDVRFLDVIASGNRIAEIHRVRTEAADGETMTALFYGFWTLRDGKVCKLDEALRMLEGDEAGVALD